MKKLSTMVLIAAALVGCAAGGGSSTNTSYATSGHCFSYDYSNTGFGNCSGRMWH
jgi:hypothetical protein